MDIIFKNYDFIFVYIDDILILSDNVNLHLKHLDILADLCIKHGLAFTPEVGNETRLCWILLKDPKGSYLTAGPDFYNEFYYPAFHFIQIEKVTLAFTYSVNTERKIFYNFNENDVHYRRGLGIKVILQALQTAFKNGFRTYGGKNMFSSVMISPAKNTPPSAKNIWRIKSNF